MEWAVIAARFLQFCAASILFGAPLFRLYAFGVLAPTPTTISRPLTLVTEVAAVLVVLGALAYLGGQTAIMAGDATPESLWAVIGGTALGLAVLIRLAAAAIAIVVTAVGRGQRSVLFSALLGGIAIATFPWTGHGAAQEGVDGWVHLLADLLHLLTAGVWIGALSGFVVLVTSKDLIRTDPAAVRTALARFSGIGSVTVALIVASGLINSWFLVGPSGVGELLRKPYGLILTAKVAAFAGMLALAAFNRFSHTPRLAVKIGSGEVDQPIRALRGSILLEAGFAAVVLALVAVLGMQEPLAG